MSSPESAEGLADLLPEILLMVLEHLSARDIARMCSTCSKLAKAIRNDHHIWRTLLKQRFQSDFNLMGAERKRVPERMAVAPVAWRQTYKDLHLKSEHWRRGVCSVTTFPLPHEEGLATAVYPVTGGPGNYKDDNPLVAVRRGLKIHFYEFKNSVLTAHPRKKTIELGTPVVTNLSRLSFDSTDGIIAAGFFDQVQVANLHSCKSLMFPTEHASSIRGITCHSGVVITASNDNTAKVFSMTGQAVRTLHAPGPVARVAFDGNRIVTMHEEDDGAGRRNVLKVWDVRAKVFTEQFACGELRRLGLDGDRAILGGVGEFVALNLRTGEFQTHPDWGPSGFVRALPAHYGEQDITSMVFYKRKAVLRTNSGWITVADLDTLQPLYCLEASSHSRTLPTESCRVTPGGIMYSLTAPDGMVAMWNFGADGCRDEPPKRLNGRDVGISYLPSSGFPAYARFCRYTALASGVEAEDFYDSRQNA